LPASLLAKSSAFGKKFLIWISWPASVIGNYDWNFGSLDEMQIFVVNEEKLASTVIDDVPHLGWR